MFFVYVMGMKGPEPQKWQQLPTNGSGEAKKPLQQHQLSDGLMGLSIEELMWAYPYKSLEV